MKKFIYSCLFWSILLVNTPAFAEDRAVNIGIGSDGAGSVDSALRRARKIIGQAIANGTVDTFIVHNTINWIEGGLSACAEAGVGATPKKFNAFVKQIRSIRPSRGVSVGVHPVPSCVAIDPLICGGFAGIACPGNQACVDDPKDDCDPAHGGADCSGVCVASPK